MLTGPKLSTRRKADREAMALLICGTAVACGAHAEIVPNAYGEKRHTSVRIEAPRELGVTINLDAETRQPDVFVCPWSIRRGTACLSSAFPGDVNPFHFHKSTTVCDGFEDLIEHLRQVLTMARDGTCFDADRETAMLIKRAQQRASISV